MIGAADDVNLRLVLVLGPFEIGQIANHPTRTQGHILQNGEFWLTETQSKDPPVRDWSDEWGTILKASTIPPNGDPGSRRAYSKGKWDDGA